MKGVLTIKFLSDTAFSMPASRDATVDSDVSLDTLGLPEIPGKTLHGILRDTWLSLDNPAPIEGIALLGKTLSNNAEGRLRIGTARIADTVLREWIAAARSRGKDNNPLPPGAMPKAFLTTRFLTAQSRETGRPETETLRVVRVVPAGTELQAPLTVRGTEPIDMEFFALLCALTRHGGLDRNRGLGHIKLSVAWGEPAATVALPALPITRMATRFVPLCFTLTAPALLTSSELDANSRISRKYIPGSAVRGAVAALLEGAGASDDILHALLASGTVRWLNAYPADAGSRRGIPVPVTARRDKDATKEYDNEASPIDEAERLLSKSLPDAPVGGIQRQPLQSQFLTKERSRYNAVNVRNIAHTHQTRNRETGITHKDAIDSVYVYEALEEGQVFIGALAVSAEEDALEKSLGAILKEHPLFLGRSARSQYGGLPDVSVLPTNNTEPGFTPLNPLKKSDIFFVRLTSDVIVRNKYGQHDPYALKEILERRFEGKATIGKVGIQVTTARGYSRLWRNEYPGVPAAAMGSVARCQATIDLSADMLIQLQAIALGERTAEGYGCFGIFLPEAEMTIAPKIDELELPEPSKTEPQALIEAQRRLYTRRLRSLLAQHAIEFADEARNPPPPSTTQRLRTTLRGEDWDATLNTWLTGNAAERLKDTARRKLDACRVNNKKLSDWLVELLAKPDDWPTLSSDTSERLRYRLVSEEKSVELWAETKKSLRRHFLDTLLSALAKKAQEEEAGR